jgi:DNA repair exonuclease SbcCD nuclease subunit
MATADVHLGMKFASYGALQSRLAEARFEALSAVVRAANEHQCDLLIVAGDLFHRVGVAGATVERAAAILNGFEGEVVAVLPGNHDFRSSDADRLWSGFAEASGDRTLVLETPTPYDLRPLDLPAVLLCAPCDAMHGADHRVGWMREYVPPEPAGANPDSPEPAPALIGVAHGSIDGLTLDAEGRYFPMTPSLLAGLPPDVWVVGHTHRQHHLPQSRLVVPGTPEPDGFDFSGPGQAALITLEGDRATVDSVKTGQFTFVEASVRLDPAGELAPQLAAAVPDEQSLVRLSLHGSLNGEQMDRLRSAIVNLESGVLHLRINEDDLHTLVTQRDVDSWYASGSFAHRLLSDLLEAGEEEAAAAALELIRAVAGDDES